MFNRHNVQPEISVESSPGLAVACCYKVNVITHAKIEFDPINRQNVVLFF